MDGSPVGKSSWISKVPHIKSISSFLEIIPLFVTHNDVEIVDGYEKLTGRIARYKSDEIDSKQRFIKEVSQYIRNNSRQNFADELMSKVHPVKGRHCTLAMINPLNGQFEWVSVDCNSQYDISTLICEHNASNNTTKNNSDGTVSNAINNQGLPNTTKTTIIFADLTNYWDHRMIDTQLTWKCPSGWTVVIFCNSTKSVVLSGIKYQGNYRQYRPYNITVNSPQWMHTIHKRQCYDKHYAYNQLYKHQPSPDTDLEYYLSDKDWTHFVVCPFHIQRYDKHFTTEIQSSATITREKNIIQSINVRCAKFHVQIRGACINPSDNMNIDEIDNLQNNSVIALIIESFFHYGACEIIANDGSHKEHLERNGGKKCSDNHVLYVTISQPLSLSSGYESMCPPGLFQCEDGHCVSPSVIDGTTHICPDGSDVITESVTSLPCMPPTCHCGAHYYHCPSGGCISWDKVSDGTAHCNNGEDENLIELMDFIIESNVFARDVTNATFYCINDTYIPEAWLNDLIPDCLHGDDEPPQNHFLENTACISLGQLQCSPGHPRCFPFHALCVFDHNHYGHIKHCRNGAHLAHCLDNQCLGMFKCPHSYCVPAWKLCDDVYDCPGGQDEHTCTNESLICRGFFKCKPANIVVHEPKQQLCVHPLQICDGQEDCPHGDDEHLCDVAPCPYNCDCLGRSMVCDDDSTLDTHMYRAVSQVNVGLSFVKLLNSSSVLFLNISHNSLGNVELSTFVDLPTLVWLDMSNNKMERINSFTFKGLQWLTFLNLEKNSISHIEFDAFTGLKSLPILNLSKQRLPAIRINLFELDKLLVLNVSANQLTEVNNLKGIGVMLQTVDMRGNPLKTVVNGDNITSGIQILTDFNYLCCLGSQFVCEKEKPRGLCSWPTSASGQFFSIIIHVMVFVLNVMFAIIIKVTLHMGSGMTVLLLLSGSNLIMALSGLMARLKDPLFKPLSVHVEGGGRHIWCLVSSIIQVYTFHTSSLMIALYGVIKYVNINRLTKETKQRVFMLILVAVLLMVLSLLLSLLPLFVSMVRYHKLPAVAMTCSILTTGDVDTVMTSVGVIVFVSSFVCMALSVGCNIQLFMLIQKSTGMVTGMGGQISGRKRYNHVVDLAYSLVIAGCYMSICVVGFLAQLGVFDNDTMERLNLYVFPLAGILPTLRPVYKLIKSKNRTAH